MKALHPLWRQFVPERLAAEAPILVALLPELGVVPAPPMDSPRTQALRLQASLTGLMIALAGHRPFVVFLEDWRGADEASREFFNHLIRNLGDATILVLTSTRRGDEAGEGPTELRAMPLEGLAPGAVEEMLSGMLGTRQLAPTFVDQIVKVSQGLPLAIEQVLEDLVKRDILSRRQGRWNTEAISEGDLRQATPDVLRRERMAELVGDALLVARSLATLGLPASLELIQAVTDLPEDALLAAIETLVRGQTVLLAEGGGYSLTRREDARDLYEGTEEDERRRLHGRAANWLERQLVTRSLDEAPAGLVAALFEQGLKAGYGARVVPWGIEAARRSFALYDLSEAERTLRAIADWADAAEADPLVRYQWLRMYGDVQRLRGELAQAEEVTRRAIDLAVALDRRSDLCVLRTTLAKLVNVGGRYKEGRALCEQAVTDGRATNDTAGVARALLYLSRLSVFAGDMGEAATLAEEANVAAAQADEPGLSGQTVGWSGYLTVASSPERVDAGVAQLKRAIGLLKEAGDLPRLIEVYGLLGEAQSQRGQYRNARFAYRESHAFAKACGFPEDEGLYLANAASMDAELGDFEEAVTAVHEVVEVAAAQRFLMQHAFALAIEAAVRSRQGYVALALDRSTAATEVASELGNAYVSSHVACHELEVLLAMGRLDQAAALGASLAEKAKGQGEMEGRVAVFRAAVAIQRNEVTAAEVLLGGARSAAARLGSRGLELYVAEGELAIAMARGDWADAHGRATRAVALANTLGAAFRVARLSQQLGEIALAQRDGAADRHFAAALDAARAMEAPGLELRALFGRAAADPNAPSAAGVAAEARSLLERLGDALSAEDRARYFALPEHQPIITGQFAAFHRPRSIESDLPTRLGFPFQGTGEL